MRSEADLETRIGQMFMLGFRGLDVHADAPIVRDICERHLGGVVLFDYDVPTKRPVRNIQSPEQIKRLVAALRGYSEIPVFVGIDQEGGRVNRLKEQYGFPPTVSAQYLGQSDQVDVTAKQARITAKTLADLGINLNFAPVVDLETYPENPIVAKVERSFSADPEVVIRHARAWITGHHEHQVLCALKHFPGHGSSRSDTHLGFVDVTDTWITDELRPYADLIGSGFDDMVMTAHIFNAQLDAAFPATLSANVITGILRQQLGYEGVVISDDMQMQAIASRYSLEITIRTALEAGVDILTFGNNLHYQEDILPQAVALIKTLVKTGAISEERIDQSYQRICRLKKRCGV